MNDERIRRGATFEVTLKDTDLTAETATITISDEAGIVATKTEPYVNTDGVMYATLQVDTEPLEVGEYEYMYTIVYEGNVVVKLPDVVNCEDGNCDLPKFIVCEANDIETTS